MRVFTHEYKITIFEGGRFCWINHGWVKPDTDSFFLGFTHTFLMLCIFFAVIKLCGV